MHDTSNPYQAFYDSAHAGASNDFDGTHTLASLNLTDFSTLADANRVTITGGALQITQRNGEFTTTPVIFSGTGVPFGRIMIEFLGSSVSASNSQLYLFAKFNPNGGGNGIPFCYAACVTSANIYVGYHYNTGVAQQGQNFLVMGGGAGFAWNSAHKYRLTFELSAGIGAGTDLRAELIDLTTGDVTVVSHDADRAIPITSAGPWGIGAFFCTPATITRLAMNFNFGSSIANYAPHRPKFLCCDGDSITWGNGSSEAGNTSGTNYPSVAARLLGADWDVYDIGKPGLGTNSFSVQNGLNYAAMPAGFSKSVYSHLGGCNDLDNHIRATVGGGTDNYNTPALIFTRIKSNLQLARSLGFSNIVCGTVLYSQEPAFSGNTQAQNTALYHAACDQLNAMIRTQLVGPANGNIADAIADFNAIPQLLDTPGSAYFAGDGRHPSDAGYALMGPILYGAIASIPGLVTSKSRGSRPSARGGH